MKCKYSNIERIRECTENLLKCTCCRRIVCSNHQTHHYWIRSRNHILYGTCAPNPTKFISATRNLKRIEM